MINDIASRIVAIIIVFATSTLEIHSQVYEKVFDLENYASNLPGFTETGSEKSFALTPTADGGFLATTHYGGQTNHGAIVRINRTGSLEFLVSFTDNGPSHKGKSPLGPLMRAADGNYYGMTNRGGTEGDIFNKRGTVFRMEPSGALTTLVNFTGNGSSNKGQFPHGALTQGADGNLYGTTSVGGANGEGTVFRMTPTGTLTTLVSFTGNGSSNKGRLPFCGLVRGDDGDFYGTTFQGGAADSGTVFKMTPSGSLTTLVSFTGNGPANKGRRPSGVLLLGADGNFYGTTSRGGGDDKGTVFRMTPTGTLTTLVEFTGNGASNKGSVPTAGLLAGPDGNLYGSTYFGGSHDAGTIFRMTPEGTLTTLVEFTANDIGVKGRLPNNELVMGADGNIYGTTVFGGRDDLGTMFRMTTDGELTTILELAGAGSVTGVFLGNDGSFYGTTPIGLGTGSEWLKLDKTGVSMPLEALPPDVRQTIPSLGRSMQSADGDFYGTVPGIEGFGGSYFSHGAITRLSRNGELTTLLEFTGNGASNRGSDPRSPLADGGDGFFYGTTLAGGANNLGTIFRMTPEGALTTLVSFTGNGSSSKGSIPFAGLLLASDGNFYGSTTGGGANGEGTIFRMTPDGVLTTLVNFTGNGSSNKGSSPRSELIEGSDGNLYGTTRNGGTSGFGTVFKMTTAGSLTTLASFTENGATNKGSFPETPLIESSEGVFYGTTPRGGVLNTGTVFRVTSSGQLTTVFDFAFDSSASNPGRLTKDSDGDLYGVAETERGFDAIFRLVFPGAPSLNPLVAQVQSQTSVILQTQVNARGSTTALQLEYGTDGVHFPDIIAMGGSLVGHQSQVVGTTLSGLQIGTTYFYRFRATNGEGTTISPTMSFSTLAAPVVSGLPATDISPTGAILNGTVNARNFDSGVIIEWGTDGNSFPNKVSATPSTVTGNTSVPVSFTLGNQQPGQTIFYRVVATNVGGSSTSGTQSFRTLTAATARITTATALSTTRAQVAGFVDPKGSNADVSFEYGTDGINFPNSFSASPSSVSGDQETEVTATLTGLTQGTTYHVRIRAQGPGGTGLSPASTFSLSVLSGLVQVFPDPPPPSERMVTVNFTPSSIGAWRFAGDTEWRSSGVAAGNLASGQRVIEYLPVPGFNRPPSETADVTGGADITLERGYFVTPSEGSGSLTVRLKPDGIAAQEVPLAERAQWRIVGEADWRDSGDLIGGLAAGSYLVESKPVAGKETPPTLSVSIADADSRDLTLTYFTANTTGGSPPVPISFADVSANEDMPFAYVGQIQSEVGASTGFVVKRRVVATAAHVVFDDGTLGAITDLRWFFQRHKNTHEPRPQIPRGYYLTGGYADQRIADNSPGQGSVQSQNLDYAALYFNEEAGRGGYGGYLASDSGDDNEFLNSSEEKLLAGYPVDGVPSADKGKLHATPVFTPAMTPAFGETWTTTAVRGLGGMSGGPLFVRFQNGAFLPAAIYLGGSGQTVVRAIDSDVVELFLRAEVSANGGDNNTGGGITHTSVAGNLNVTQAGSLRVNIEPADAVNRGAAWKLNPETILRLSSTQKSGLSPGTYSLAFTNVAGYLPPAVQAVTVTGGQLTTITYTYGEETAFTPLENWRFDNFGTTGNTGDAADDNDFDKDGMTNIDEFTAGTDPKNGSDVFKIATTAKAGNTFTATCAGKAGRTYTLLRNTGLSGTWTRLVSQGTLADDAGVSLSDTSAPPDKSFYRIEVSLP